MVDRTQTPISGPLDHLTILVITDGIDSIEPLVESLRAARAIVIPVPAAAIALTYADRYRVDAILVDLRDAEWWLTPEIRALRAITQAPLYGMTAPGELPDSTAVAGLFPKPVLPEALIATLSVLPRRRR